MPDVPPGRVTPVTCPVIAVPPEGVAEKVYPVMLVPPAVDGATNEIPMEFAMREVTAKVPGVAKIVDTSPVAGNVFPIRVVVEVPTTPKIDRVYLVPANNVVGDTIGMFAVPFNRSIMGLLAEIELDTLCVPVTGAPVAAVSV